MNKHQNSVPLKYLGGDSGLEHMLYIPVTVGENEQTHFIFDTGIGVNLLSLEMCERLGLKVTGEVRGKRMTGQEITIPMTHVSALKVGDFLKHDVSIAQWDVRKMLPNSAEFQHIEGYLSLTYFVDTPFTIDYQQGKFVIEDAASLQQRAASGESFPLKLKNEGGALTIFVEVKLPNEQVTLLQLDLGTNIMTLDKRFAKALSLSDDSAASSNSSSIVDETGYTRERFFSKVDGSISLGAFQQAGPTVMFQDIIHDGIIGNDFFKNFAVTYDLAGARLILN